MVPSGALKTETLAAHTCQGFSFTKSPTSGTGILLNNSFHSPGYFFNQQSTLGTAGTSNTLLLFLGCCLVIEQALALRFLFINLVRLDYEQRRVHYLCLVSTKGNGKFVGIYFVNTYNNILESSLGFYYLFSYEVRKPTNLPLLSMEITKNSYDTKNERA